MKTLFTAVLLIFTVAVGFGQIDQKVKRYGYTMYIPHDWEVDKRKDQMILNDPNWEVFVTFREFNISKEEEMLKEVTNTVYKELKNYIPKAEIDKEMIVATETDYRGQKYLKMVVQGGLDEDNEITVYEARMYKNNNKVLMVTVLDFGNAIEFEGMKMATGKYDSKTNSILRSLKLD
ncbi:MAG: hypothetical protein MK212_11610 [Saprospiraceae bacterium]|nr:hypothetical protein [Saprospiraceae bacterium]